jgi:hypothetical protein
MSSEGGSNPQNVTAAMSRLQAGGPASALRLIAGIAKENAGHDPATCADCALMVRIAQLCELGLAAYDSNDATVVAARLRDLECKLQDLEVWGED